MFFVANNVFLAEDYAGNSTKGTRVLEESINWDYRLTKPNIIWSSTDTRRYSQKPHRNWQIISVYHHLREHSYTTKNHIPMVDIWDCTPYWWWVWQETATFQDQSINEHQQSIWLFYLKRYPYNYMYTPCFEAPWEIRWPQSVFSNTQSTSR